MIHRFNDYIKEGLRDQMTPKSSAYIDEVWEDISKRLLDSVKIWGDLEEKDAIELITKKKDLILYMLNDGHSLESIAHSIVFPDTNDGELRTFERKKNRRELKEEQQRKDEKRYLSERERKRLNDSQRRYLVNKRKEMGSWNDADLKESIRDKMIPKPKENFNELLEKVIDEISNNLVEWGWFETYKKSYNYVESKYTDDILELFSDNYEYDEVVIDILRGIEEDLAFS
jgi:hypothetical protein